MTVLAGGLATAGIVKLQPRARYGGELEKSIGVEMWKH